MKTLPRKTWAVKFSRRVDLAACGFVGPFYKDGSLCAWSDTRRRNPKTKKLRVRTKSPMKMNQLVERIRRSKRNCHIVSKSITLRDYEFLIPFHYDSYAVFNNWCERPRIRDTWDNNIDQQIVGKHQVIRILNAHSRSFATRFYNYKILPFISDYKISNIDFERLRYVYDLDFYSRIELECDKLENLQTPLVQEANRRHRWMIRARECDRVLTLITKVGADAVLARVLEFNHR